MQRNHTMASSIPAPLLAFNPYDILLVEITADMKEIKQAHRRLAMLWHPDRNGSTPEANEKFALINAAYKILGDEDERVKYDQIFREQLVIKYVQANREQLFRKFLDDNRKVFDDTAFAEAVVDHNTKLARLRQIDEDAKLAQATAAAEVKAKADAEASAKAKADAEAEAKAQTKPTTTDDAFGNFDINRNWGESPLPTPRRTNYASAAAAGGSDTTPTPTPTPVWQATKPKQRKQTECKYGRNCFVVGCKYDKHPEGHDPLKVRKCPHWDNCRFPVGECLLGYHPEGHDPKKIRDHCPYYEECFTVGCHRGDHPVGHDPIAIRRPCHFGNDCRNQACTFKH